MITRKKTFGPLSLQGFLRREIKPTSKVLVVGPGILKKDPSTKFIYDHVRKNGKMTILDNELTPQGSGYGGLNEFKKSWRKVGKKLPLLREADATNTRFKKGSFDVVYDHNALPFICQSKYITKDTDLLNEYLRILKRGGKVILAKPVGEFIHWEGKINPKIFQGATIKVADAHEFDYYTKKRIMKPEYRTTKVIIIEKKKRAQKTCK